MGDGKLPPPPFYGGVIIPAMVIISYVTYSVLQVYAARSLLAGSRGNAADCGGGRGGSSSSRRG